MRRRPEQLAECLRHVAVIAVIALGILTILASGGGEDNGPDEWFIALSASGISSTEISLAWTFSHPKAAHDVSGVYMDGAFLTGVAGTSLIVSGLVPDTEYCFVVVNEFNFAFGEYDIISNTACATTLPLT